MASRIYVDNAIEHAKQRLASIPDQNKETVHRVLNEELADIHVDLGWDLDSFAAESKRWVDELYQESLETHVDFNYVLKDAPDFQPSPEYQEATATLKYASEAIAANFGNVAELTAANRAVEENTRVHILFWNVRTFGDIRRQSNMPNLALIMPYRTYYGVYQHLRGEQTGWAADTVILLDPTVVSYQPTFALALTPASPHILNVDGAPSGRISPQSASVVSGYIHEYSHAIDVAERGLDPDEPQRSSHSYTEPIEDRIWGWGQY